MRNMHSFGQAGLDAYVDGEYIGSVAPGSATEVESFFYSGAPKRMREITLYLPLYLGVAVNEIGIDSSASLLATEKPYSVDLPVVYYGTSITQGGCASRPGMSYQAILGRRLNVDFANFGFSGAGKERARGGQPARGGHRFVLCHRHGSEQSQRGGAPIGLSSPERDPSTGASRNAHSLHDTHLHDHRTARKRSG
jgi:hypothetical protein